MRRVPRTGFEELRANPRPPPRNWRSSPFT